LEFSPRLLARDGHPGLAQAKAFADAAADPAVSGAVVVIDVVSLTTVHRAWAVSA
jgi:hypothetical protein